MLSPEEADEVMDGVLESGSYEEYVLEREVECEKPVDRATFDAFRNLSKYMATRWPGTKVNKTNERNSTVKTEKKYTKKQIREAIARWTKVLESMENSGDNPFDMDNVKQYGWVVYLKSSGICAGLPVDFDLAGEAFDEYAGEAVKSRQAAAAVKHSRSALDMSEFGEGVGKTKASFFSTRLLAEKAANVANIDSGAYDGTCAYIWDAVKEGYLGEDSIGDMELGDIQIVDTYVCGDGSVIMGRDSLEDNAHEWELDNQ